MLFGFACSRKLLIYEDFQYFGLAPKLEVYGTTIHKNTQVSAIAELHERSVSKIYIANDIPRNNTQPWQTYWLIVSKILYADYIYRYEHPTIATVLTYC